MGTTEKIILVRLSSEPPTLTLETSWFTDQARQTHFISVMPDELESFNVVLGAKPFGRFAHVVSVESISSVGTKLTCTVRIACAGSRQTKIIEVCETTFAELEAVFDSNIISEGYIRA